MHRQQIENINNPIIVSFVISYLTAELLCVWHISHSISKGSINTSVRFTTSSDTGIYISTEVYFIIEDVEKGIPTDLLVYIRSD